MLGLDMAIATYLKATRAFSLPASVLPVLAATAATLPPAQWDWLILLAGLTGAACLHLAGNLFNDYFDFLSGVDRRTDDDAGRPGRQLVRGELVPRQVLAEAVLFLALAAPAAAYVLHRRGAWLLPFALAASLGGYAYTGPPFRLKCRALGEAVIFALFGPLLLVGAAWSQTGRVEPGVLLLSVPMGLATVAILVGNNWRDRDEDAQARIRTLGQLAGGRLVRGLYVALVVASAGGVAGLAAAGLAPPALLAAPLLLGLLAAPLRAILADRRLSDIDARTARYVAALNLAVILAFVLRR